ncbi:acyl-protein synthetase [Clostridium manihotivorum]|uniref:Acyl-protein synthetase n=1 Tax=Clostridium manihotivorum TaxID=2320868 RepID=A0A410E1J3_9CLOT|nr:acyl-protein synthetase [Clostridium manihotivorum]QAA35158.1 acyl-protein synthetase [Clostridium manihotivorum]
MSKSQFFHDFKENIILQYLECPAYKFLCDSQGYDPRKSLNEESDLEKVPYFTTTLFKKSSNLFSKLLRVAPNQIDMWTVSSSTSGDPSIVGRSLSDIEQLKRVAMLDPDILDPNCDYDCVFYPEPLEMRKFKSEHILGKPTESYIGNILNLFEFKGDALFLLKQEKEEFNLDIEAFKRYIQFHDKKNHHLSVRGSTLLIYNTIKQLREIISPVELGEKVIVSTGGGGWDGKKGTISIGTQIPRRQFVEEVSSFLGIPQESFVDTYSFTENSLPIHGHYSKEHGDYLFHVPNAGKVIIRDIKTLKPLSNVGDKGVIQILNAYGTSTFAGASVLVDDIGEIVSMDKCPKCGQAGMTIKILGRVKGAEAKGCGATLDVKEKEVV